MIPFFLEKYKSQIENYKLETVRILPTPIQGEEKLSIKQSKFLGVPYFPIDKPYPQSKDGTPMIMFAQINFSEIPELKDYPNKGILQLFVPANSWYDMEEFEIIYHESTDKECQSNFNFLTADLYEESPINCEHKLSFKKEIEFGGREDFRFQMDFDGKDYFDFQETLPKDQQEEIDKLFYTTGHKIGGYAYFTQSDPRDYDSKKKDDVLLFQIDTDDEIMFGDSGVANIFINIDDLKNRKFDNAYFNWDCC